MSFADYRTQMQGWTLGGAQLKVVEVPRSVYEGYASIVK
jgi:hypothetical protein